MAVLTAKQLEARENLADFTIDLGNGDEVIARVPDLQLLILQGVLPMPLLGAVSKMIGAWAGAAAADLTEDMIAESSTLLDFVNIFTVASLVAPKVVMTPAEMGLDTVLVSSLTLNTRKQILNAVMNRMASPEVVAKAEAFPGGGSSAGAGSDVPEIQAAAV